MELTFSKQFTAFYNDHMQGTLQEAPSLTHVTCRALGSTHHEVPTFHSFHFLRLYCEWQFREMEFFPVASGKIQLSFVSTRHLITLACSIIKYAFLCLALDKQVPVSMKNHVKLTIESQT